MITPDLSNGAVPTPVASAIDLPVVKQPGKLIRLAAVAKAMLDEARSTPCDAAGCERLKDIYLRTIHELEGLLSDELRAELSHLVVPFEDIAPTPSEVRVAQAELVGWLEGLFGGIATAVRVQELEAADQADALSETFEHASAGQYL